MSGLRPPAAGMDRPFFLKRTRAEPTMKRLQKQPVNAMNSPWPARNRAKMLSRGKADVDEGRPASKRRGFVERFSACPDASFAQFTANPRPAAGDHHQPQR